MTIRDQQVRPATGSFDAALTVAVRNGARGEAVLVDALRKASGSQRAAVVTALGEAQGPSGASALRHVVADPTASPEERCAGLVALAKRKGAAASDVFAACMGDDDAAVRKPAFRCMACVGDDRVWPAVYRLLRGLLDRRPPSFSPNPDAQMLSEPSEIVLAIGYLARHLNSNERVRPAVGLVRSSWDRLRPDEQEWVETYWPACSPACSPAAAALRPDADSITRWLSHPVLMPVYLRDG